MFRIRDDWGSPKEGIRSTESLDEGAFSRYVINRDRKRSGRSNKRFDQLGSRNEGACL